MDINRILIIRFSSLGDIILLTPLFRETKKRFPGTTLDFLTSTTFASVCSNNPYLDSIIPFQRSVKGELSRINNLIKKKQYDLILDAHHSLRSRLILHLGFGFLYKKNGKISSVDKRSWKRNLLIFTKINLLKNAISQREAYCNLLRTFSNDLDYETSTELFPGSSDLGRIKHILHQFNGEGKPIVAFGPGASFEGKRWPKEYYLQLSRRLIEKGYRIILLGGQQDREPEWIAQQSSSSDVLNMSGKLSYLETAAMLSECSFSISNDSAIVHFSEAVKTPSISIFGPTVKEFGFGPFLDQSRLAELELSCRPCSRNGKGKCRNAIQHKCLKELSVDMVYDHVCRLEKQISI